MKKAVYLLAVLTVLLVLSAVFFIPVLAEVSDDTSTSTGSMVPDDAFDGGYAEFKGNDGSVTRVFDNGSIRTVYEDGSKTGVDYKGNMYSEDKDGNYSVRTTDGYSATAYSDGRKVLSEPDGKSTTFYPDGRFSEEYENLGIVVEYDENYEKTGIGFSDGNERLGYDENGNILNGEISGPNGAKLTVTDDGINMVNPYGKTVVYTASDNKETWQLTGKDGSSASIETTTVWTDGNRQENTEITGVMSDGTRYDANLNLTYDAYGNPVYSDNNVCQYTFSDGTSFWSDGNSNAYELKSPDGTSVIADKNGNVTTYIDKDSGISGSFTFDGGGEAKTADVKWGDGARLEQKEDGSVTFTLPNGTKYEADGKGNVWKNGIPIKKDGKWVQGYEPEKDTGEDDTEETPYTSDEPDVGSDIDPFMGTWHWTETVTGDYGPVTVYYSMALSNEGSYVGMVLTLESEDGEESETFRCDYYFDGESLTLYNDIFGGGRSTLTPVGDDLNITGHGEGNSTVTAHR